MTVEEIIDRDFEKPEDKVVLIPYIELVRNNNWGVGNEQLLKSLLILSEGSIKKFKSFFPITDPRDIIVDAQKKIN